MSGTPILDGSASAERAGGSRKLGGGSIGSRRGLFFGLIGLTTLAGTAMMLNILRMAGLTSLEIAILPLFALTFAWISIAFWNAIIGFVLMLTGRDPLLSGRVPRGEPQEEAVTARTALVMPIHNEEPTRVMDGLAATMRSLVATGEAERFDVYLLSDTTEAAIASDEQIAWKKLRAQSAGAVSLHYRRRRDNIGRKAGNIADFCERWGDLYDFMVVLDADSVMTGPALVELVLTMQANPAAGLIQTVPVPLGQTTLFGRLLQFAACLYSPMLAAGQSFWQGDAANYWGHNAIVRVRAFKDQCELPVLRGAPPWGGEILSHDFVEAALLRRAGWHVYLMPSVAGSYEELPGTILDYAKRDRRWAQGSLQHLRLLLARGLHPMSRLHFVLGALGYVSSMLWLLLLLASTAYIVFDSAGVSLVPVVPHGRLAGMPLPDARWLVSLLLVTTLILFVPKLLGLALGVVRRRASFGGARRLVVSALLEMLFAVVVAPLMMIYHARFVLSVLMGQTIQWSAQRRHGRDVGWAAAVMRTSWISVIGLVWLGVTLYYSPRFALWLAPILVGILLAAPLVRWTSSGGLGAWTRQRGLFVVPSETAAHGAVAHHHPGRHLGGGEQPPGRAVGQLHFRALLDR
ncbi:MAG TPA: glucans biosynthesis glucosyltransferase MdoH [Acidobacteriota bacterium]|nr:glucans biosynthesis glucosyltransferase MdoH [Acidobacteriota bacterium]